MFIRKWPGLIHIASFSAVIYSAFFMTGLRAITYSSTFGWHYGDLFNIAFCAFAATLLAFSFLETSSFVIRFIVVVFLAAVTRIYWLEFYRIPAQRLYVQMIFGSLGAPLGMLAWYMLRNTFSKWSTEKRILQARIALGIIALLVGFIGSWLFTYMVIQAQRPAWLIWSCEAVFAACAVMTLFFVASRSR